MNRVLRAEIAAQHLDRAVCDDLVGVHVGLGAGAGLPNRQRKMIVELAFGDLGGGDGDGAADHGIEFAERHVGLGRCLLDHA